MAYKKPVALTTPMPGFDFTEADLAKGLADPQWRLSNIYSIIDAKKQKITFKPNDAQQMLFNEVHTRNIVLKARKLGFSTAIAILGLDTALFSPNETVVFIAQDMSSAEAIFRGLIRYAYDNLPEPLKKALPLEGLPSKTALAFTNKSVIEVRTSSRGGTPTFLWVSEFGKIAAKDNGKAKEIITGSITSVAEDGLIFIESTAEGNSGAFFDLVDTARKYKEAGKPLLKISFKFFFFAWWQEKRYVAPPELVTLTKRDEEYFEELEAEIQVKLTPEQKAWRVQYCAITYSGDEEMFWQEMPATPDEAFKVSLEGSYFREQFRMLRKERRIGLNPVDEMYPVSVFFDIGASDETSVWAIQKKPTHYSVINFTEASGETFKYFVDVINGWGYIVDQCFLPHDANHMRQGQMVNTTPADMVQQLAPFWQVWVIPRTPDKQMAIQQARNVLRQCVFDEANCHMGLKHLEAYRKKWDSRTGTWSKVPRHGQESNAADAFQQFAQAVATGAFTAVGRSSMYGSDPIIEPELGF